MNVLVADPDRGDRNRTVSALRLGGFRTQAIQTLLQIGPALRRHRITALIVDPAVDEPAVTIGELRSRTDVPIIVVSPRATEADKVAVLDAGADDYLTKPFGVEELLARLRAVLRRVKHDDSDDLHEPVATEHFTIHLTDRIAYAADGSQVHLTPVEWRILDVLVPRAGRLVPHADILKAVWGEQALGKPGSLRVSMTHIRAKLEPSPSTPRYFITAPGLGVRFDPTGGRR